MEKEIEEELKNCCFIDNFFFDDDTEFVTLQLNEEGMALYLLAAYPQ